MRAWLLLAVLALIANDAQSLSLSLPRGNLCAAATSNTITFIGGGDAASSEFADVFAVDGPPEGAKWVQVRRLSIPRDDLACAAVGSLIIAAGGASVNGLLTDVDVFNASAEGSLSSLSGAGKLSVPRRGLTAAIAGNQVVFAGGDGFGTVDVFDAASRTWQSTSTGEGRLCVPRSHLVAASADSLIIFAGGVNLEGAASDEIDIFDATTRTWSCSGTGAGRLSVARFDLAAAAVRGKIAFAGGASASRGSTRVAHATVDIYDVATRTWFVASLSSARWGLAGASVGQYIVFSGGATSQHAVSATVDVYDTLSDRWFVSKCLSKPRAWLAGASANGVILFGGGVSVVGGKQTPLSTVDVYSPVMLSQSIINHFRRQDSSGTPKPTDPPSSTTGAAPTTGLIEKSTTAVTSTTHWTWSHHDSHAPDPTTNVDGPIVLTDLILGGFTFILLAGVALFLYVRFVRRRPLRGPSWELRLLDGGDSDEDEPPPLPPGVQVQVVSAAAAVTSEGTPSIMEHDSTDRQPSTRPA